jgi:hypothetical protein
MVYSAAFRCRVPAYSCSAGALGPGTALAGLPRPELAPPPTKCAGRFVFPVRVHTQELERPQSP